MISFDSIIVRTGYYNHNDRFYLLNKNGEIINYSVLREHKSNDSNDYKYFYYYLKSNHFINNTYFTAVSIPYRLDKHLNRDEEDELNTIEQRKSPLFVKVQLFNPNSKREFFIYEFYKEIGEDSDYVSNDFELTLDADNNRMLVISRWSDKLFVINLNTMKLTKTITLKSNYSEIGTKPISNKSTHSHKIQTYIAAGCTNGGIEQIYFDKFKHLYYVVIRHNADTNIIDKSQAWSLHILDKDFHKLQEIPFAAKEYDLYGTFLIVKQGILIPKMNNQDEEKPVYTLFSVNYSN
ncbi:MAG: hypothetical protein LBR28_06510 [Bacteroidales bacterium]|jgi:hypothetical protein|nr:hypothetical protein [Bacteroidales bacterium]